MIPVSRPSLGAAELQAVAEVFASGWLGLGSTTYAFEDAVKQRLGCRQVVAVSSGTAALHVALMAWGIGPGDEVLVPSLTFAASIQAILAAGATPVFCDSHDETLLMDPEDAARRITPRTRAVMPVHYAGQACNMDSLLDLAQRHGLVVIEDAAHAFGATAQGRPIGSFGHATCFSFDPIKTPTCGEGGAVVLSDEGVAERLRRLRLLGIDREAWKRQGSDAGWAYAVTTAGYRYHLPNFCAAIGLAQLKRFDSLLERRRTIGRHYDAAFRSLGGVHPLVVDYRESAAFLYIVRVEAAQREAFMATLKRHGVETGVHYIPNHLQPFFKPFVAAPLPRVERVWPEIVSLPLFGTMTDAEVEIVIAAVQAFHQETATACRG